MEKFDRNLSEFFDFDTFDWHNVLSYRDATGFLIYNKIEALKDTS